MIDVMTVMMRLLLFAGRILPIAAQPAEVSIASALIFEGLLSLTASGGSDRAAALLDDRRGHWAG
jgi:hypothetical protein